MRNQLQLLALIVGLGPGHVLAQPDADEPIDPGEDPIATRLAAQAGGLTAEGAAESAARNAPEVQQADAQILAGQARTSMTMSRYVPRVGLSATYRRTNPLDIDFSTGGFSVGAANEGGLTVGTCPDGVSTNCVVDSAGAPVAAVGFGGFETPQNNYSLDLTVNVPLSDYVFALPHARTASKADEASLELQKRAETERVKVNAKIAFYDWAKSKAQVAVAEQSLAGAEARLGDARIGLDAGTVTSADVLGLESLVASSQVALAQAQSFERLALKNLQIKAQVTGPLSIGEDVSGDWVAPASLGSADDLVASGLSNRAEVRALQKSIEASAQSSKGAAVGKYPKLEGIAGVTHANPNQGFFPPGPEWNTSWFVGASLSWHVDGFFSARAQARDLDANTATLRAQLGSIKRGIEMEVRSAWEELERATAAARISETELKAALATYEQRVLLFRAGAGTSTDIVDAELKRHNATLRSVGARIDQRIAMAKLQHASAMAVPEAKR